MSNRVPRQYDVGFLLHKTSGGEYWIDNIWAYDADDAKTQAEVLFPFKTSDPSTGKLVLGGHVCEIVPTGQPRSRRQL